VARKSNNPRRDWGVEGWPTKPSKSVRKAEGTGICDRTGAIAVALTALAYILDPFGRTRKKAR